MPTGFHKTRTAVDLIWNAKADHSTRTSLHGVYRALRAAEQALTRLPETAEQRLAELRRTVAPLVGENVAGRDAATLAGPGYTGLSDLDDTMARLLLSRHAPHAAAASVGAPA
ncbi:hypothetical protein [Nocardiopsis ansamitocini]|uniref:hypothetical protein n=1 Tax=Nocardiopsis ansamitocini TaxID=1670832 RepID=UPI002556C95B|nr:hypothetical protein [Nocardiopsis ansamitocini]